MDGQTPFKLLCEIEAAIKAHHPMSEDAGYGALWRGIQFQVGEVIMMTPVLQVKEVIPPTNILPLPRIKRWLKGVIQHRGELILINDLSDYLFKMPTDIDLEKRILVIENKHEKIGFLMPKVFGIVTLESPKEMAIAPEHKPYDVLLQTCFKVQGAIIPVLDFDKLLHESNFLQTTIN